MIRNCVVTLFDSEDLLEAGQRAETFEAALYCGVAYVSRPSAGFVQGRTLESPIDAVLLVHTAAAILDSSYAVIKNHPLCGTFEVLNVTVTNHEWALALRRRVMYAD